LGGVWLALGPVGEPVVVEVAGDKALLGADPHSPAASGQRSYPMEASNYGLSPGAQSISPADKPSPRAQSLSPAERPIGVANQPGAFARTRLGYPSQPGLAKL
jgi:hypothetical protein